MSTPTSRRKPGPKPLPTTFALEDLVADVNSRAVANANTVQCVATGETIIFDRTDQAFRDRLTGFLKRAAQTGAILASDVTAWADFLEDDGSGRVRDPDQRTRRRKTRSGRIPQVYDWGRYDFEAF